MFGALLVACNIVFDYARIRIVVEDRRSAIGALARRRAVRAPHPARCGSTCSTGCFRSARARLCAARAGRARRPCDLARARLGQIYILLRHYVKLLFYASETAFFQGALAHAAYTAAPPVVWPDRRPPRRSGTDRAEG